MRCCRVVSFSTRVLNNSHFLCRTAVMRLNWLTVAKRLVIQHLLSYFRVAHINPATICGDCVVRLDEPPTAGRTSRLGRRARQTRMPTLILAESRRQFATKGFARTSIRSIAHEVGVAPSLVLHFFGNKDHLFREATALKLTPDMAVLTTPMFESRLLSDSWLVWPPSASCGQVVPSTLIQRKTLYSWPNRRYVACSLCRCRREAMNPAPVCSRQRRAINDN